jgi:hypothetical protein
LCATDRRPLAAEADEDEQDGIDDEVEHLPDKEALKPRARIDDARPPHPHIDPGRDLLRQTDKYQDAVKLGLDQDWLRSEGTSMAYGCLAVIIQRLQNLD